MRDQYEDPEGDARADAAWDQFFATIAPEQERVAAWLDGRPEPALHHPLPSDVTE